MKKTVQQEGGVRGQRKAGGGEKGGEKKENDIVILCWCLNKQAGHVEQNIPVYLKVLLHRATTAPGHFSCLEECWWKFTTKPSHQHLQHSNSSQ